MADVVSRATVRRARSPSEQRDESPLTGAERSSREGGSPIEGVVAVPDHGMSGPTRRYALIVGMLVALATVPTLVVLAVGAAWVGDRHSGGTPPRGASTGDPVIVLSPPSGPARTGAAVAVPPADPSEQPRPPPAGRLLGRGARLPARGPLRADPAVARHRSGHRRRHPPGGRPPRLGQRRRRARPGRPGRPGDRQWVRQPGALPGGTGAEDREEQGAPRSARGCRAPARGGGAAGRAGWHRAVGGPGRTEHLGHHGRSGGQRVLGGLSAPSLV